MKCHFYIQSNLNAIESGKMQKACEGYDIPVTLFKVIPFKRGMPQLRATFPFVLIGSTTLNRNALKSRKYRHGVFFNNNFKPSLYAYGYSTDYLNFDMDIYKIKDIPNDFCHPEDEIFIRSNDDSKEISGGTVLFKELLDIKNNTETHWTGGDLFGPNSEICISPVQNVLAEYRFIVMEGKIAGCSRYRPSIHYAVPDDVKQFAQKMIAKWQPHDIFVLDICETNDGLKVVECNCVNGSGWYDADYGEIVYHMARYQEAKITY